MFFKRRKKRKPSPPSQLQPSTLDVEPLESRLMLAFAPFVIDLGGTTPGDGGGGGGVDLFSENIGGALQDVVQTGGSGDAGTVPIGSDVGPDNLFPNAVDDTPESGNAPQVDANDGPTSITFTLLSNDSDPDGDPVAVNGVSNLGGTQGRAAFNAANGQLTYDPNGRFAALPEGATGTDTFSYTIADPKGKTATATVTVEVAGRNDAPTISGAAAVTVDEGKTAAHSGTIFDPDMGDVVQLSASVGSVTDNGDGTWNWSLDTTDGPEDGRPVTLTATDSLGATATLQFEVTVNNVAPPIDAAPSDVTVDEGQQAVNRGGFTDPGDDAFSIAASAGALVDNGDGSWSWSIDTTDGPDDTQPITVTATDSDGAQTSTHFTLNVNNVAPTVAVDNAAVEVDEGQNAVNFGSLADVGEDAVTLTASVGTVTNNGDGTWSWSFDATDGPIQSQQVTITATDSDGAQSSVGFGLTVNNVAPTISVDENTVEVDEGQPAVNSGSFGDVGTESVNLAASIGTVLDNGNGTWSWSLDATDGPDQNQTVTITATDSDGASTETAFTLVVNNLAPSVTATQATVTVDEGKTATNSGTFSDPGTDDVTLSASIGTITDAGAGTWSWSLDATDGPDQNQTVTITATDSDGAATTTAFALVVNNLAPNVTADHATVEVTESQTAANTGTFSDPGDDSVILSASVGAMVDNGDGTWSWSLGTTDGPDQNQTVTITATDSDGAATTTAFALVVNNLAPNVTADHATVEVTESQTAANTGTFSDPGDDSVTLSASVGAMVDNGDGTWSWSLDATDGPDQNQTVTITATDSDGAATTTTFALVVNNLAPNVTADHATVEVTESQTAANTGTFSDPGDDSVTLSASVGTMVDNGDGTWSWSLGTTDGPDQHQTVTITATDSDGAATTTTFALVVNNAAPVLFAENSSVTVDEGQTALNSGTFADVAADTVTKNTDGTWGWQADTTDGPVEQTVTITASDEDGGQSSVGFEVTVDNVAPVAADHTLPATGNVPIEAPLAGATDPGDDTITVDSVDTTSAMGGSIAVADIQDENSPFTYTPPAGFEGKDRFQYTVIDKDGATATGTVTVTVRDLIWFVDGPAGGDGTLNAPFHSFAPINTGGSPSSNLELIRIELGGDVLNKVFLEFDSHGGEVNPATIVFAKLPDSDGFEQLGGGFGYGSFEADQADGQTFGDFIAPFHGEWTILVDFNGNLFQQGQEADDGLFHIDVDLNGISETSFLSAAVITSPTPDQMLTDAEQRRVTVEWNEHPQADFILVGAGVVAEDVVPVSEVEVPDGQTSVQSAPLPSDQSMLAFVGAGAEVSNLVTQDAQDDLALGDLEFSLITYTGVPFTTAPIVTAAVAAGDSTGDYAGGASQIGGVDFSFTGVDAAADFSGEFFQTADFGFMSYLFGGEAATQAAFETFSSTGPVAQIWQLNLADASEPVAFESVSITVGYDENLFGFDGQSPADVEQNLRVYQLKDDGSWESKTITGHDPFADTITFEADGLSPVVLVQEL